jgi:CheY-like chemotaxis protein
MDTLYAALSSTDNSLDSDEVVASALTRWGASEARNWPVPAAGEIDGPGPYRSGNGRNRATVMIVDDDVSIAEMLAELLRDEGYDTVIAHDGLAALAYARREPPDLILSDDMMPGLTGMELVQELSRLPSTRSIALVLMSSAHPRRLSIPNVPFLPKPFEINDVLDLVERNTVGPVQAQLYGEG